MSEARRPSRPEVGLCAECRHAQVVRSARGSEFWRCRRAESDAGYRRYPMLPVRACPGHEAGAPCIRSQGAYE